MTTVHAPIDPGQPSDPSLAHPPPSPPSPPPDARTLALLESIEASIKGLKSKIAALEQRLAAVPREPPSPAPRSAAPRSARTPPFAICNDGRVLLAVAHVSDRDLSHRECWVGIVLNEAEVRHATDHLADHFEEAAARAASHFPVPPAKPRPEPTERGRTAPNP